MAYQQVSLPAPAANGSGAAVDVSSFGATKTITVTKGGTTFLRPSVIIEVSNQASPTKWAPLAFFQPDGEETVQVAARWMRATVTNYKEGAAPTVELGGEDDGTEFATLVAPAGNGSGAGVDTSALGVFKTVHVAGPFQGACNILVSQDGGTTYQQSFSFLSGQSGIQSKVIAADFMKVERNGVPVIDPGLPVVNVGACNTSGGGGGDSGNPQRFQYTVTGSEPDLSELVIPLPSARADANYLVFLSQEEATMQLTMNIDTASKQVGQFTLSLSGNATAGDVFNFFVVNAT